MPRYKDDSRSMLKFQNSNNSSTEVCRGYSGFDSPIDFLPDA